MKYIDTAGDAGNILNRNYWVQRANDWAKMALADRGQTLPVEDFTKNVYRCLKRKLIEDREISRA